MNAINTKPRAKMAIAGGFTQAAEANKPAVEPTTKKIPMTRTGRVACPFWVPATARVQLKHVVADLHMTSQEALVEALNDWFVKHDKPPIA